jgi:drug/metabolite transporter (DMT)-like permease
VDLRRLRIGELTALAGVACIVYSLFVRWYEGPGGTLDAWDTFGPGMALVLAAGAAGLALVVSTVAERTVALPVALAVWTVVLGLAGLIAAIVRVLERPDHATEVCVGAWLALAGTVLILAGAWQSLRDERTSRYESIDPHPRPMQ